MTEPRTPASDSSGTPVVRLLRRRHTRLPRAAVRAINLRLVLRALIVVGVIGLVANLLGLMWYSNSQGALRTRANAVLWAQAASATLEAAVARLDAAARQLAAGAPPGSAAASLAVQTVAADVSARLVDSEGRTLVGRRARPPLPPLNAVFPGSGMRRLEPSSATGGDASPMLHAVRDDDGTLWLVLSAEAGPDAAALAGMPATALLPASIGEGRGIAVVLERTVIARVQPFPIPPGGGITEDDRAVSMGFRGFVDGEIRQVELFDSAANQDLLVTSAKLAAGPLVLMAVEPLPAVGFQWSRDGALVLWSFGPGALMILVFAVINLTLLLHRQEMERNLEAVVRRFRLADGLMAEGIIDWRPQEGSVFFSGSWKALVRTVPKEEIPDEVEEWFARIHPHDRDAVFERLRALLDGTERESTQRYRLLAGELAVDIEERAFVARARNGRANQVVLVHRRIETSGAPLAA